MHNPLLEPNDGKDAFVRACDDLIALEPRLKGREDQVAAIVLRAILQSRHERGESVPTAH
jgi:hypothetical protein